MSRIVILGAGGRDFHVFNTCYRDDPSHEVVAFTATQIPAIDDRMYPPVLSGPRYPDGIPILPESDLESIIRERGVEEAIFAYSDVPQSHVAEMAHRCEALGVSMRPFDPARTMLQGQKPCVAVCAVRTGCGKSALSRYVVSVLRELGRQPAILRHPMPYGDLRRQVVDCTIEEMEEYEPHIQAGSAVFAGADYAKVLAAAEQEADVILWDGGNNDTPFVRPDLYITLLDPLRPGHELTYFPGRWNFERADVLVIGKTGEAQPEDIETVTRNAKEHNPEARLLLASSPVSISDAEAVRGKRALVIEDGPTVSHGGMGYGAGMIAAQRSGASEIVDPRPYAAGDIATAFREYPHLQAVVPALGYGQQQIADLEATIDRAECDVVVIGTPIDLGRILRISKPSVRVTYGFAEESEPGLAEILREKFSG
ncbi:MAG: GTPase [Planctomycetota bacterium]|jgi:predicted GTPase